MDDFGRTTEELRSIHADAFLDHLLNVVELRRQNQNPEVIHIERRMALRALCDAIGADQPE